MDFQGIMLATILSNLNVIFFHIYSKIAAVFLTMVLLFRCLLAYCLKKRRMSACSPCFLLAPTFISFKHQWQSDWAVFSNDAASRRLRAQPSVQSRGGGHTVLFPLFFLIESKSESIWWLRPCRQLSKHIDKTTTRILSQTIYIYIYIYILHTPKSGYTFFISICVPWGIEPTTFWCSWRNALPLSHTDSFKTIDTASRLTLLMTLQLITYVLPLHVVWSLTSFVCKRYAFPGFLSQDEQRRHCMLHFNTHSFCSTRVSSFVFSGGKKTNEASRLTAPSTALEYFPPFSYFWT